MNPSTLSKEQFVAERAQGAYNAADCQRDCTYDFSKFSQATEPNAKDAKERNKATKISKEENPQGFWFVPPDVSNTGTAVFIDVGFATYKDITTKLGYWIILIDGGGHRNIVRYASIKSRRVTKKVLNRNSLQ